MQKLLDHPRLQLVVPASAVVVFAVVGLVAETGQRSSPPGAVSYGLCLVAGGALLIRRRSPAWALATVVVARIIVMQRTGNDGALVPAAMVALYTAARSGTRRDGLLLAIVGAVPMIATMPWLNVDPYLEELPGEAALMLLPIAVGDGLRTRADRLGDLIETEAAGRVHAERLRIARDLHDVVAHGLSVITVQSGVAAHLIERDPAQAKDALEIINATGKHSLEELRTMVGVLRSTDDETPLRPTPHDPDDLTEALTGAERAGLRVSTEQVGRFDPAASDACVVAVHRILQEALTNVARHAGPVDVVVRLQHHHDRVELQVHNAPGTRGDLAAPSTGVGIIGMTERAESLGGSLQAGPGDDGGFEVAATVPHHIDRETPT